MLIDRRACPAIAALGGRFSADGNRIRSQAPNELPQPQVCLAFGL
jgi:hypothetical protein